MILSKKVIRTAVILLLMVIMGICAANAQILKKPNWENWKPKVPKQEYVFLETHWDLADIRPGDDSNDKLGIHYGIEFGVRTNPGGLFGIEAKVLHENFPKLLGGYKVYGGGIGIYWVVGAKEQIMYQVGWRAMPWVYRTNPSSGLLERRENMGIELKWTYTLWEKHYFGFRYVYEGANDMEIIDRDLVGETRYTVNFVLGTRLFKVGSSKKKKRK